MRFIPRFSFLLLVLLYMFPVSLKAQGQLSDRAFVSLLTCGPGEELYSVFGHTALRVADPETGMDVVFNYGMFDFNTPLFYLKFIKGDLKYFASAGSYQDFVYTYQYYNRDVFEQRLNLTQAQKQQVVDELAATLNSDKKYYTYRYFGRNCTTMVADVLNNSLNPKISQQNADTGKTYRRIVCERLHNSFYESLGINLIFGAKTDNVLGVPFLPEQLMQGVTHSKTATGEALTPGTDTVYKSTTAQRMSSWNNIYTFLAVCALLIFISKNIVVRRSLYALLGLLGLFFCFVGLYSYHTEITWNYNALLVNPLLLVLLYFSFAKNQDAIKKTTIVIAVCILVYLVYMLNKPHLLMVLPIVVLVLSMLAREMLPFVKQKFPSRRNA